MAEHYLRQLIAERRAAIVQQGRLVAMHIEREGDGLPAGAIVEARLVRRLEGRGIARAGPEELLVEPWPKGATEGQSLLLEIRRQAWLEPGRERLAKARPTTANAPAPPQSLSHRLTALGHQPVPGWPGWLEEQWADSFEAAALGRVALPSGSLSFTPTPAFVAVDVDGTGKDLGEQAVKALAQAITLWGLGGSILIDLPQFPDRMSRAAAADAFDSAIGDFRFERTAINGFGLMQVICPRLGPSILERARLDSAGTAAIALLEQAGADRRAGPMRLVARPTVIGWIRNRPGLLQQLQRQTGRPVDLAADPMAKEGHVELWQENAHRQQG